MPRVLLVEDDPGVREGLELGLRHLGHTVTSAASGEAGLELARSGRPEVVVLDVMLPGIDGFETCRRLRASGDVPIVLLTARGDDLDVVAGLEAGADDYVVKPVRPRVLDARLRTILRRVQREPSTLQVLGGLAVDRSALTVTKGGAGVHLTPIELRLLLLLTGAPGQVFSRGQLLQAVWEQDHLGDSRLVDACVQRLRAKIEDDTSAPVYLQTVRGFGYRFGPL